MLPECVAKVPKLGLRCSAGPSPVKRGVGSSLCPPWRTQCVIEQSRAGAHLCDPTHRKSPEESKSQRQEGGGGGGGGARSGCGVLLNGDRVSVQEGRNSQGDGEDGHTTT